MLCYQLLKCAPVIRLGKKIQLHLAERIADLRNGANRSALVIETIIDRDGVEGVSRYAGQRQQHYPAEGTKLDALLFNKSEDAIFQRILAGGLVIGIAEAIEVLSIVAEQEDIFGNEIQLIQIQVEHEDIMLEMVNLGGEPVVHD